jgi:hypothetical protein
MTNMASYSLKTSQHRKGEDAMLFTQLYQKSILGVIEGLDRIRFRGTDRMLSNVSGFSIALHKMGVLHKDFKQWADRTTKALRAHCEEQARKLGIEIRYLPSSNVDKEALAREIAQEIAEKKVVTKDGSICMFSVVESCIAPTVCPNKATKQLDVVMRSRKCVFIYYYFDHPLVGFGNVRLQTWAPYTVHICLNGRHWLEKQLIAHNIDYLKADNCFPWISDVEKAQALMDEQLKTDWPALLNGLVTKMCPSLFSLCDPYTLKYYWSADETEFATDVMFRSKQELDALFPTLLQHAMRIADCQAVLRFFGKAGETTRRGKVPAQIQSDCRKRYEGIRIKHWVKKNSLKMYNKADTILRGETTTNDTRDFKAFRPANDDETKPAKWQKMRKGVSDLHRRCEVSAKSNERYLDAMCMAQVEKTLHETARDACNRTKRNGRPIRAMNPWNEQDFKLLTFLAKGEWALNGFRNKNLCAWFTPQYDKLPPEERKKLSAKSSRLLAMLRAHGLIRKVSKEHRYLLTEKGQMFATALLISSNIPVKQLTEMAA